MLVASPYYINRDSDHEQTFLHRILSGVNIIDCIRKAHFLKVNSLGRNIRQCKWSAVNSEVFYMKHLNLRMTSMR